MVVQGSVRNVAKGKIKKNLSSSSDDKDEKPLAGQREALALEVLHMMFMKRLANKSNFVAFQDKKTNIDKNMLQSGFDVTMDECFGSSSRSDISDISEG